MTRRQVLGMADRGHHIRIHNFGPENVRQNPAAGSVGAKRTQFSNAFFDSFFVIRVSPVNGLIV